MTTRTAIAALALGFVGCKGESKQEASRTPAKEALDDIVMRSEVAADDGEAAAGGTGTAMALDEGKMGRRDRSAPGAPPPPPAAEPSVGFAEADKKDAGGAKRKAKVPEGPTRAWFPETFLFEPRVVTDASGAATVPVRVPDRLTTWRVLALAHARSGAQGGAVTSFLGTLPTYIDPIVPPFLTVGDEIRLPIQLVNTTPEPVTERLAIEASNATLMATPGARTIPAQGSVVEYASLRADRPGTIALRAALGDTDAVERTIEVRPAGKRIRVLRSGTLAAPRSLAIEGPGGSDPATDRVRLLVYPGALALLRSELGAALGRGGVADDAYALLLAGRATALLAALGGDADPDALRTLAILATQRAIRHGRTLDVASATLLAEAALAHPDHAVLARLGARAAGYLAQHQLPDGTFGGGATGWTLQRLLVATADATRAVGAASAASPDDRHRALAVAVRARGAFERNLAHVSDGYTAAAILASGAVGEPLAGELRARIRAAIRDGGDGTRFVEVPAGVVRADGTAPSIAEATALAVLALAGDPDAPLADLGATLLGSYSLALGWGDGRANLAALQAVLQLFDKPVPPNVTITLTRDGQPVTSGVLEADKLGKVLVLEAPAPGLSGLHTWELAAEPAVPGLGFSLALHAWVPWPRQSARGGLELSAPTAVTANVGKPVELALGAIAPSAVPLRIEHALPAGVQADTVSLDRLVAAGTITRYELSDGKLVLEAPALSPGQLFTARYRAIPTLAGKLRSGPSSIEAGTARHDAPPAEWSVR
jgi:hypothetical protein